MRNLILSLSAAGAAIAFAAPAAAQYYPQPQPYGYGYNGYNNSYGQVRALQARISGVQRGVEQLSANRVLSRSEARRLRSESIGLQARLMRAASYGLNPMEVNDINYRVSRLEQRLSRESWKGPYHHGYGYGYGYNGYNAYPYNQYGYGNGYYRDRDGDGMNDDSEHDRWHADHEGDDSED